jgi:hypothetical protein
MKGGIMKRSLLCLLIVAVMGIITCGNESPEPYYEGTPEDSAAIQTLLDDNPDLQVTEDLFDTMYVAIDLDDVEFSVADSFIRDDTMLIKQHADSCALVLQERKLGYDFWFTKDTSCTVFLYDTFTVLSLVHCDVKYTAKYDSAVIDSLTGDTITWRIKTVIEDSTAYYDTTEIPGVGVRHIFFEPERDTTVNTSVTPPETLIEIVQPMDWLLRRISYGTYYFPEAGSEIPVLYYIILDPDWLGPRSDTIYLTSYDTTYAGHVMNRFKAVDSLLEYTSNDTMVSVKIVVTTQVPDTLCSFFASCGDTIRVEVPDRSGDLPLAGSGITNISFEDVNNDAYYYLFPKRGYKTVMWLIPVRLGGTP